MWHRLRSCRLLMLANVFTWSWSVGANESMAAEADRSPIALAVTSDGSRLLVANQTAGSVSLIDPKARRVDPRTWHRRPTERRGDLGRWATRPGSALVRL